MSAAPWAKFIDSEWYDYPIRFDAEYRVDDATAIIRHESIRAERMAIPVITDQGVCAGQPDAPEAALTSQEASTGHPFPESGQAAHTPWQPAGPLTTAMVISFWGFCTLGSLYGLYRLIWR